MSSVLGVKVEVSCVSAEEDGRDLGVGIFKGEILVPGRLFAKIAYFAFDPDVTDLELEEGTNFPGDLAYGIDFLVVVAFGHLL